MKTKQNTKSHQVMVKIIHEIDMTKFPGVSYHIHWADKCPYNNP